MEILEIIAEYCRDESISVPAEAQEEKAHPKKKKGDTRKVSFDLFREGNSVSQIAAIRKLSNSTIENHLALYVSTGEIPVSELVSQELIELISVHFEGDPELKMGPVKEQLGEKASWSDIRFVRSHLIFSRSSNS
jgi:uncharacterized protein YpbB